MQDQCMQLGKNKILFYVGRHEGSYDDEDICYVVLNVRGQCQYINRYRSGFYRITIMTTINFV